MARFAILAAVLACGLLLTVALAHEAPTTTSHGTRTPDTAASGAESAAGSTTTSGRSSRVPPPTPVMDGAENHEEHSHEVDGGVEIICRRCGLPLTSRGQHVEVLPSPQHVVGASPVAELGPDANIFVLQNSAHQRHRIATFAEVTNVGTMGVPSSKDSYFEEYSWRPIRCARCATHLGWEFIDSRQSPDALSATAPSVPPAAPPSTPPPAAAAAQQSTTAGSDAAAAEADKEEVSVDAAGHVVEDEPEPPMAPMRGPRGKMPGKHYETALLQHVLAPMEGVCLVFPQGWWTFELCYGSHVRQYHSEPDGSTSADWSMGKYQPGRDENEDAPADAFVQVPFLVQQYTGGQICHENDQNRASTVMYFCCESSKGVHIESLHEPSTCKYEIHVCVPALCGLDGRGTSRKTPSKGASGSRPAQKGRSTAADAADAKKTTPKKSTGSAAAAAAAAAAKQTIAKQNAEAAPQSAATSSQAQQPQTQFKPKFYGLLWDAVLDANDQPLWWINSVEPVTGIFQ